MRIKSLFFLFNFLAICLFSCGTNNSNNNNPINDEHTNEELEKMYLKLEISNFEFKVNLENNEATKELLNMVKNEEITINLNDYGGFEKVGELGRSLPTSNERMTTKPGDIVLYQGDQIVMFYGSNTWGYTMLGHVEDLTNWNEALEGEEITAIFSYFEG